MQSNKISFKQFFQYFKIAFTGKEQEFTSGSIRRAVFMLAIPMILEMLMESIFALVDIAYVSRVSVNAVATIGLTESVITLIYAIAIGLSMAATAVVARRVGEKNLQGARESAVQVILLGITVAIITGIIGAIYSKEILGLMGGSTELIQEGHGYTRLMIGGNIPGETRVLSIALFDHVEAFNYQQAHILAIGLVIASLVMLSALYLLNHKSNSQFKKHDNRNGLGIS